MNLLDAKRKLLPLSGYMGGGSGGGGGQTTSTSYQTNIPEYARPYVETMLGATQNQLFQTKKDAQGNTQITGFQPYKAYGGTYDEKGNQISYDPGKGIAGFQPMQTRAQEGIANMQMPGEYGQASAATQQAMQNMQNMGYQAGNFGNQFQAPQSYQTGQFNAANVQGPSLQNYQMQGPQDVQAQQFGQAAAEQYMSPYMQSVVEKQQRDAQRQADIATQGRNAQAVQAGAFGGSRQAIMDAEAARNLAQQKSDIQATGQQAAYQQAQQQFNADQAQRMQAALANQGMGYNVGAQNLAANLGIQQLGAGQNLQAQLANQQMGMNAQQLAEQSRQFGAGQGLNAAQLAAQYGLAGQQLGEQSRQYGAGFGLQANQAAQNAANQLANIGGQRLQAQQGIYNLQNQYGAQQQALEQQKLNQAMQDYANAQQYPLMQLGTMSNMIRGLPMQASTTNQYMAQPNQLTQAIGAAGTGASIYNAFKAKGGIIKDYAKGGIMSYDVGGEVESDLENMNDEGLQRQIKESSSPSVKRMAQRILRERQMEKGPGMAGGGIIAFAEGSEDPIKEPTSSEILQRRVMLGQPTGDLPSEPSPIVAQPQGIMQAKPADATAQAIQGAADLTPAMKALQSDVSREAGVSTADRLKEIQDARKTAGIEAPNVEQRAKLMAERANAEDEANRNKNLRMAEFFSRWGSTPGPTLVAGMQAVKASVPDLISDQKEAKRIRMEIDKSIAALDEATRLDKKGDFDAATAIKTKWADRMQTLNMEIIKIQEQEAMSKRRAEEMKEHDIRLTERGEKHDKAMIESHERINNLKIASDEKIAGMQAAWHKAEKENWNTTKMLGLLSNAQSHADKVENEISNIMKSTAYADAVRDREMYRGKTDAASMKMFEAANKQVQELENNFATARKGARDNVNLFREKLGISTPVAAATTPPPSDRPSLNDPRLQK